MNNRGSIERFWQHSTNLPPLFCIAVAFHLTIASAGDIITADDIAPGAVRYTLDDFEDAKGGFYNFPVMFGSFGSASGVGDLETTQVHGGKQSARLEWDNGKGQQLKDPRMDSTYVFYYRGARLKLLGEPISFSMWVFAEPTQVGTPIRMLVQDDARQVFASTIKVTQAGWSEFTYRLADFRIAGKTQDAITGSVTLIGFFAGEPLSKGSLIIDDLSVVTKGPARSLLVARAIAEEDGIGWGHSPRFAIKLVNHSNDTLKRLALKVEITDALAGKSVLEKTVDLSEIAGQKTLDYAFAPQLPNGVYDVTWSLCDTAGLLPAGTGDPMRIGRMRGDVGGQAVSAAEKRYVTNWGLIGGTYWSTPLPLAKKLGTAWERLGNRSLWVQTEREPGHINPAPFITSVQEDSNLGLGICYFNTIYNQPSFYSSGQEQFATKYGQLHVKEAAAAGDLVNLWEFGNEDNGTARYIWSEIARNGAAGVRSQSATAMLGTTGTGSVDVNFMRLQQARGLFERLDAIITHPYTWSTSPEAYGVEDQLAQINQLIDDVGGMKIQLTTEFGYSENFDQLKRAQWIPRFFAIAASAGLYRNGLYAFNQEFGIFNGVSPTPPAISLNAYAMMTYGHHFAGWLEHDASVWAATYEKGGKSLIMAWSPAGKGQLKIPTSAESKGIEIRDLFGNVVPVPAPALSGDGKSVTILVSESPLYIFNLDTQVMTTSYRHELERARVRLQRCLAFSELKEVAGWKALAEGDAPKLDAIRQALMDWEPKATPISKSEQAVIAQAVRLLSVATHAQAACGAARPDESAQTPDLRPKWTARLKNSVADDVDLPALRWLLHTWNQTRDEMAMVKELPNTAYVDQLASMEPVYDHLAGELAEHGPQLFFPIWPYLHAPAVEGKLVERFVFQPGRQVPVRVRLQSYSALSYEGEVSLELPMGWKATPTSWKGKIDPLRSQEIDFSVTAGNESAAKAIAAILKVPGKPLVRIPFDDFSVFPPLEVKVPVLSKLLPEAPLPLELINHGSVPLTARLRIVEKPSTPALARTNVESIAAGQTRTVGLAMPGNGKAPAWNEWNLLCDVTTSDGKNFQIPLSVDFDVAVRAKAPPTIDGDLTDWKDTAPLHIDLEAYTHGSYLAGWSREDESAVAYTQWDEQNFYIAVHVHDQTFQQALSGADTWMQDSVQFCLVGSDDVRHLFTLAQTPRGPQIWGKRQNGLVGQLKVVLKPGDAFYEAAIPWSAMPGIKPTAGQTLRFDVALNDDDAIVKRRTMERYGVAIVGATENSDALGYLHLGQAAPQTAPREDAREKVVFNEDFEEYTPGTTPDTWTVAGGPTAVMSTLVRAAVGINGSQCLEIVHTQPQAANVYFVLTRPITGLIEGKKYRLSFKVKGTGAGGNPLLVGTCLDTLGIIGYNWPPGLTLTDQWQEVKMDWTSVGGDLRAIIKNEVVQTKSLLIDDVKVTEIP